MGWDVILGPPNEFRDWREDEWNSFWDSADWDEEVELGGATAVASTLETIRVNLEGGEFGSLYPTFGMLTCEGFIGWYLEELPRLFEELSEISNQLKKLPLNKQIELRINTDTDEVTLSFYAGNALEDLRSELLSAYPNRPLENLYDVNHYFLETLAATAKKAINNQSGVVVSM